MFKLYYDKLHHLVVRRTVLRGSNTFFGDGLGLVRYTAFMKAEGGKEKYNVKCEVDEA
jgi:hypothetical protein